MNKRSRAIPLGLSIYEWIILALIFLSSGLGMFLFGAVRVWSILPLSILVFLALLLFALRPLIFRGAYPLALPPGWPFVLLFTIYAALQIPFSLVPYEARVKFLMMASAVAAYWMGTSLVGVGRRWKVLLGALIVLISVVGWYAIIQKDQPIITVWGINTERTSRVGGTYICPNHFANMAAIGIVMSFALLITPEVGAALKIIGAYAIPQLAWPLVLTQSRSGLLGVLAGVSVVALLAAFRKNLRRFWLLLVVLPLLAGAAGWGLWKASPQWKPRIELALRGDDGRLEMWSNTVDMIKTRPWLGYGGGSYRYADDPFQTYAPTKRARYAHNEILNIAAEYGLVGAALFLLIVAGAVIHFLLLIRKTQRNRDALLGAAALGVAVGCLVHAQFDYNFHIYSNSMAAILIFSVAASRFYLNGDIKRPAFSARAVKGMSVGMGGLALLLLAASIQVVTAYFILMPADRARAKLKNDRAEHLYALAQRIDPGNWNAVLGRAHVNRHRSVWDLDPGMKKQYGDEAIRLFEKAYAMNPGAMDALYGMSFVYERRGDRDRALGLMKQIVEYDRQDAGYHTQYGLMLLRAGREPEAVEQFQRAVKLNPADKTAALNLRRLTKKEQKGAGR